MHIDAESFFLGPRKERSQNATKYICVLFVCLTIHVIYLEIADDYTFSSFLAAFEKFIARRGLPAVIYNDKFSG